MSLQSLLFRRDEGWTARNAKQWAQKHGYRSGDVDVTDQYVRLRQFAPGSSKVKRTITLGRGIRAVVAREESMATTKKASKRRSRRSGSAKKTASAYSKTKRSRAAKKAWAAKRAKAAQRSVAAKRSSRRRKPRAVSQVKSSRRRSKRRSAGRVMEASRRAPRRSKRRRSARVKSWRGDPAGHRKAAKKGWRRKKARKYGTREATGPAVSESRRRSRRARSGRRSPRLFDLPAGGTSNGRGMYGAEFAATILFGGLGFAVADGVDRLLATYNPAGKAPTDKHKFTSDGAGTLANTLNVAASPGLARIAAGIGMAVLPGVGSFYVKHPFLRHSLEGASVGAGISLFKTFWNNVVMGAWLGPKDTTTAALQHSTVARLYPAEVVAAANLRAGQDHAAGVTFGALSSGPTEQTGVGGHGDVGPFAGALAGSSPYMDVAQALRCQAGLCDEPAAHPGAAPGGLPAGGPGPAAAPAESHEAPPEGHPAHHGGHHGGAGYYAGLWPGQPRFASVPEVWAQEGHHAHHGGHGSVNGSNSPAAPGWAGLGDWRTQDFHRNEWNRRRQWELQQQVAPPAYSNVNANWHRIERERRLQWERQNGMVLGIGDEPVANALTTAANAIVASIPSLPPAAAQVAVLHTAHQPHDVVGALQRALPNVPLEILQQVAGSIGHHLHILHGLYLPIHRRAGAAPVPGAGTTDPSAPPAPGPDASAPPPPVDASPALPPPVPAPTGAVSGHPSRIPGPPQGRPPGPPSNRPVGPQAKNTGGEDCGCVGSDNPYLGFIGESQEETLFTVR